MTESTPVQIHVLSDIRSQNANEKETIELNTSGEYFLKGKTIYLRYEEQHELGFVKTTVKIADNETVVMRSGAVTMKQRFIQGIRTYTDYATPLGKFRLEVHTKSLSFDSDRLEGKLMVIYDLLIDDHEKHVHKLVVTFKEEQA